MYTHIASYLSNNQESTRNYWFYVTIKYIKLHHVLYVCNYTIHRQKIIMHSLVGGYQASN